MSIGPKDSRLKNLGWLAQTLLLAGLAVAGQPAVSAASVPRWLKGAAAARFTGPIDKSSPVLVLLDEATSTVASSGTAETHYRFAARILTEEGRSAARREVYTDEETKIGYMHAWHLRPGGSVVNLDKSRIEERTPPDDLYSDIRTKVMEFPDAEPGSIVAFEWVQKERPFINQQIHFFQSKYSVALSRFELRLPSDWKLEFVTLNHAPVYPAMEAGSYVWELHDLPAISQEPYMPELASLAPYIAISYFPNAGKAERNSFSTWSDVSNWAARLMGGQDEPAPEIRDAVQRIVAGLTSKEDQIRAIADWVRKETRYVSIQLGVHGGYKPHPASLVLKKGYGDCKDKCVLLEAMFKCIGVESHTVLVNSNEVSRVKAQFPSILQFNHAIVAISQADNAAGEPYDGFGRLLFFDPTDVFTAFGDLPYYLQGGYGLMVKGDAGELVRLPVNSGDSNEGSSTIAVDLNSRGGMVATVSELLTGQMAAYEARAAAAKGEDLGAMAKLRVAKVLPGAEVMGLAVSEKSGRLDPIALDYAIKSNGYATRSGRLLVVKPMALSRNDFPVFSAATRNAPVVFPMESVQEDTVKIAIPNGEKLDERPINVEMGAPFGNFSQTYRVSDKNIVVHRRLEISERFVGRESYSELKHFFDEVATATSASIIFVDESRP